MLWMPSREIYVPPIPLRIPRGVGSGAWPPQRMPPGHRRRLLAMPGGLSGMGGLSGLSGEFGPAVAGGGGGGNGLLTNLVGYWALSEASGSRADSSGGGSTLAQSGTVSQAAGILTNAAVFNGSSSNYLSCADNATLSMGSGVAFTLTAWVYPTANPSSGAYSGIVGKHQTTATFAGCEYGIGWDGGSLQSIVGTGAAFSNLSSFTLAPALNTWSFIYVVVRGGTPTHAINKNNGTEATQSGQFAQDGTNAFVVGGLITSGRMYQGRVCEVGLWKRALSSTDLTTLYNSGAGLGYASFT
jgi:hypothetical protein